MRTPKRLVLLGAVFTALVTASPALAARGHVFSGSFKPAGAHALNEPDGVAVNEATGDVYVVDKGNDRVEYFNAKGEYQGEFEAPAESFETPEGIAVDNSCSLHVPALTEATTPSCKSFDPSYGDVYVVDAGRRIIDKYGSEGTYLGQINEVGGEPLQSYELHGVAVDPAGAVWLYRELEIVEFTNGTPNEFVVGSPIHPSGLTLSLPGFAVDAQDEFYVRHIHEGNYVGVISKVNKSGDVVNEEVDSSPSVAVAADQINDNSFIDNITTVGVFNSTGTELERLGEEKGVKHLTEGTGIGVDASTESLYVADAATDEIVEFGPTKPEAPKVTEESISEVTGDSAKLEAEINPQSEAGEAPTEYQFEYGACSSPGSCASSPYEARVPAPAGQIEADFNGHAISATIAGLQPSTTYHYRAIAENRISKEERRVAEGPEQVFTTQSAGGELVLPDNRGWELVSPPDKHGARIEPIYESGVVQAAAGGGAITYLANSPTESQPQGYSNEVQVLSSRSSPAWSSRDIAIPHLSATGDAAGPGPEYKFFNPELTLSAVQPFGEFDPSLSEEASESTAYLHDLSEACGSSCFRPLVTGKAGFANVPEGTQFGEEGPCRPKVTGSGAPKVFCGPEFLGASEDLSQVVLRAGVPLKTGAGANQLYEWSNGALSQVSILPSHEGKTGEHAPESGVKFGLEDEAARGAISSDGNRIDWESNAEARLYQRDMALGETVQLDKAEATCEEASECKSGGGRFQIANAEGTRVFFTDVNRLTSDSGAGPAAGKQKADLYEYDFDKPVGERLTDVTPTHGVEGAEVQGSILGASADGEYVYFVARGVQSDGENLRGEKAIAGKPNLYLHHEGQTSFIATLAEGDNHDWSEVLSGQPTRVSPNGQFLELMSEARLTGYDNRDVATRKPAAEVYLFDAATNKLSCASCEPSGARPVGVEYEKLEPGHEGLVGGLLIWEPHALVAANVPGWTAIGTAGQKKFRYQPRYLNNSGRLFFDSADALVPQDSNGTQDVYEYEPPGVGSCSEAAEAYSAISGGCVSLISSGSSSEESAFLDASESGDDVFFLTKAQLSPIDTDSSYDVYDAHVCSGESPCITYSGVQSPPCTTEASCKAAPTPQPSIFGAPPSATFQGPGNLTPAAAVKAKAKPLTRAQKLAAALKACKKKAKKQRAGCEKQARKRFGPVKKSKKKK